MKPGGAVMVIEDDLEIRESLVEILEDAGHAVLHASHGQDALDQLRAAPVKPAMILLDLMMPVMDGLTFRRAQLAEPALADIPTVLISAHTHVQNVVELRFVRHLRKPIDLDELLQVAATFTHAPP